MPTQSLPNNPSLENLRKQAKSLLKSVQKDEPASLARVREFHPYPDEAAKDFSLRDAQLVIARSYSFSSWTNLKRHLEAVQEYTWSAPPDDPNSTSLADKLINLACLSYGGDHSTRHDRARELFAAQPSISKENIYTAATVGDVEYVERALKESPALARTRGGPRNWEPLLYVAYSRLNSTSKENSTLEVARLLLKHSADPNVGFLWDGNYLFTALTGTFGEGESGPINQPEHQYCYELARLLLESGADPNDSQTLYNRMFTGGTKHLELLFEFGLGKNKESIWARRLQSPQDTPAEMLQQQMGWAAKYNQFERLKLLISKGVDVNVADSRLRRTPYELAVTNGNSELAQYLLDHVRRRRLCESVISLTTVYPTVQPKTIARIAQGYAELEGDSYDRAIECFAEVLDPEKTPKFFLHWLWRMIAQLGLSDVWLQAGNLVNARLHADAFLRSALSTADPHVRVLAWELQARIAMAEQNPSGAGHAIKKGLEILEVFEVPMAAWRLHATAWDFYRNAVNKDSADHHLECAAS